jgi:hypothetical protein
MQDIRSKLISQAEAAHAQYPQYRGHWDNWILGRVKRRVTMRKTGWHIEKGTLLLMEPQAEPLTMGPYVGKNFRIVYSPVSNMDTSIPDSHVEVVG